MELFVIIHKAPPGGADYLVLLQDAILSPGPSSTFIDLPGLFGPKNGPFFKPIFTEGDFGVFLPLIITFGPKNRFRLSEFHGSFNYTL
jgi:hypothetical protein